jgi:hypothetical protein
MHGYLCYRAFAKVQMESAGVPLFFRKKTVTPRAVWAFSLDAA